VFSKDDGGQMYGGGITDIPPPIERGFIEEHTGGFKVADRCIYNGVLPIGGSVVVIGWDRELFRAAFDDGKLSGDIEYRNGLVPVVEEGSKYFQCFWVAPHQLERRKV